MAALSVCTFTQDPPAAVARSLAAFSEVADEVVAVVDERVGDRDLSPLTAVCDEVVVAPFDWPLEVNLSWLEAQCRGDWILRIDGDEVPSRALIERLADWSWSDEVTHVSIARRWLYRDPATMLDQSPWLLDPQCRLTRRGSVDWPAPGSGAHDVPRISGDSRLLVEPLYHLDLLVTDTRSRLTRARAYEASAPGLVTADGVSQNIGFYVPEARRARLRTVPVPDVDIDLLASVVDAFDGPVRSGRPGPVPDPVRVTRRADPEPAPGQAQVEIFAAPDGPLVAGSTVEVVVNLHNTSGTTFARSDRTPVQLGTRILDLRGDAAAPETRTDLPVGIPPGGSETIGLTVGPLPPAGDYRLVVGALREHIAWFEPTVTVPLRVTRSPRILITSGISPTRHLGDDLIVATVLDALALHALDLQTVLVCDDPAAVTRRFGVPAVPGASALLGTARGVGDAAMRMWRLRADAARVAAGGTPRYDAHRELLGNIACADALVVLGAGWLTSVYRRGAVAPRLAEVEVARAMGCPVHFEAGSVGPLHGLADRVAAWRLLSTARSVTVRDHRSAGLVRRLGVSGRRSRVVPDAATGYARSITERERDRRLRTMGLDPARPWAVLSLRAGTGVDEDGIVATVEALAAAGTSTVFLAHHTGPAGDDRVIGRRIARRCALVLPHDVPPDVLAVALVRDAAVVFGDRFHLAVLAAGAGVPGVFVPTNAYDRWRGEALVDTTVTVAAAASVRSATLAASDRGRGRPAAAWDAERFAATVEASIR